MMPAANQGVGMNMGFPDVCATPTPVGPVPIPYPNIGMNAMAMPFVPNVMLSMAPAQNMAAKPLLTNGDNGGVAHPMFMQPGGTLIGNPRILIGGMPASHMCVPTYGNNFNNPVGSKLVPSVTNVLLGALAAPGPAARATATLHDGVAIVRVPLVAFGIGRWLTAAVRRLRRNGARAWVLDLRGNPGGSVADAAHAALAFAVCARGAASPLVVAIDEKTASAAELLTAALQDLEHATVVGARSYGKGRAFGYTRGAGAQLVPNGVAVRFERPLGGAIEHDGVRPDVECDPARALDVALRRCTPRRTSR